MTGKLFCPEVMPVSRWPMRIDAGSSVPVSFSSFGLWSHSSRCDGPPDWNESRVESSIEFEAMLMARSSLVLASRAAGLPGPVDGVTTDLDDPAVSGAAAARARGLGFAGKLCIHPMQVAAVNAAFGPNAEDLAWAHRIIKASTGGGAVRVDGHMVDAPVIRKARAIVARAKERA